MSLRFLIAFLILHLETKASSYLKTYFQSTDMREIRYTVVFVHPLDFTCCVNVLRYITKPLLRNYFLWMRLQEIFNQNIIQSIYPLELFVVLFIFLHIFIQQLGKFLFREFATSLFLLEPEPEFFVGFDCTGCYRFL